MIGSLIAAFFLFAIAFNTPFSDLRLSFLPVYLGLIVLCLIASIIAQGRVAVVLFSALTLPVLMLIFIASQKSSYIADILVLIILCFVASFSAKIAAKKNKDTAHQ